MPKMITQAEIQAMFQPLLNEKGQIFQKSKNVFARKAKEGERVVTITGDGIETKNTASKGDYIVMNQTEASEQYIMSKKKFSNRYDYICRAKGSFNCYASKGRIVGVALTPELMSQLNLSNPFYFQAPWGQEMVAKEGDYLVSPTDGTEIYRIARKEFFETYRAV